MTTEPFKLCIRCDLAEFRRNVIIGRGSIPAPILFIGEAPEKIDDLRGEAFVGKAGKLLDGMIIEACEMAGINEKEIPAHFFTYTVGCRPCNKLGGDSREPTEQEVLECLPRMNFIVDVVKPVVVIFVDKFSFKYFHNRFPEHFKIYHPSYLLRGGGKASPDYMLAVRKLAEVFTYYKEEVLYVDGIEN